MTITYNKQYNNHSKGNGWDLYSDVSFKDSLIVCELLKTAKNSITLTFDELYLKLKEAYKNKTAKSRCDIIKESERIEVIVKGVFPRFYIQQTKS